jgi:hypothetical protein
MVALGCALVALCGLLLSCDYLLGDPYTDYMQHAVAWVDLDAEVAKAGIIGWNGIQNAKPLGSGQYVFVTLNSFSGSWAFALDGGDLHVVRSFGPSSFPNLGGGMSTGYQGSIRLGLELIDPSSLALSLQLSDASNGNMQYEPGFFDQSFNNLYAVDSSASPNKLTKYAYPAALWTAPAATSSLAIDTAVPSGWTLLAAEYFAGSGYPEKFLLMNGGNCYYIGFLNTTWFDSATPDLMTSTAGGTEHSGALPVQNNQAWLTADGIVTFVGQSNNYTQYARFDYATGGRLDDYRLRGKSNGTTMAWFEPSGRYWFLYDESSGRLYEFRTWWK